MLDNIAKNRPLPRMRTANECYRMIHAEDPDSAVSETFIRCLSKSGKIPVHRSGRRILINYDAFCDYLSGSPAEEEPENYGVIRPVPERVSG